MSAPTSAERQALYQKLLTRIQACVDELTELEPEAKVLILLESQLDFSISTNSENMKMLETLGLLNLFRLRYEVMEASYFQQKMAVTTAIDDPKLQLVPKDNGKPN